MKLRYVIGGVVLVLVLVLLFNPLCITGNCVGDQNEAGLDDFAKYLTAEGIAMAGTNWCGHCANQKEMFGDSFQYIDFHDCDLEQEWCADHNVPGYPTWVFPDGSIYPGEKTIDALKELSGYNE